ncbi:lipase family protein [Anaerobacillus isosaccharinicus]|uniref:Lipase family protein n=2 Tax=Anaerobacillus isosaccharinicus TaxID=1532552 RepID=A0A7S7L705_9BACI|nr:lipase family protein [Anaerobacillus isosaccharinicus]MBA5586108.1 lipase family protein [Anaerobacillus isosaccharinicus]QOY35624.1 lipase family protein [Anaerobacillus isosaccharinicus]
MNQHPYFNKGLALNLLDMCKLTYEQYLNNGHFKVPYGVKLVKSFKGIAFEKKEWFGFILETWDCVVIAFRGTDSEPDWIADAEAFQEIFPYSEECGFVHHGFLSIYKSCRDEIFKTYERIPSYKRLYITGHSLGAALATLHAFDVAVNGHFHKITMYNYGSPRVGNPEFASRYSRTVRDSIRFVNSSDIIPMLPPQKIHCPFTKKYWNYQHVPKQVKFSIQAGSIQKNHALSTYKKGIEKSEM